MANSMEAFQFPWNLDPASLKFVFIDHLGCIGLSDQLQISTCDACYLVTAAKLDAVFVTADKKLASKCDGSAKKIRHHER